MRGQKLETEKSKIQQNLAEKNHFLWYDGHQEVCLGALAVVYGACYLFCVWILVPLEFW